MSGKHKHSVKIANKTYYSEESNVPDDFPLDPDIAAAIAAHEAQYHAPVLPPGSTVITPTDSIKTLLTAGKRSFVLRGGTYHESFGSTERHEAGVSILPYPGELVIFDGTGLAQNWLYLGTGATWTLGAMTLTNFRPTDSGIVAVGDACTLHTLPGFDIVGLGRAGLPYDINSHGVYGHGTGSYTLDQATITGIPGAAVHHYRGTPQGTINGGQIGAFYESALIGSGHADFNGTAFVEPAAAWDIQIYTAEGPATATLTNCTGTGPNGTVRRVG